MRLYLDACSIIYLIEGAPVFQAAVIQRINQALASGGLLLSSELSRLECRSKPMRENAAVLGLYDSFFARPAVSLTPLSSEVVERATVLRSRYNFKTPDALHVASALENHADLLLTADSGFTRCTELQIEVIKSP